MPQRPARQYLLFLVLVALVVAAGFGIGRVRSPVAQRIDPVLAAVPKDAWLVVTVDVAALRQSPIAAPLVKSATAVPGLGSLADACGFDPLARLAEIAVCSPEGGERGDFGLAFAGDFSRDELARCADKVIRARGGQPSTSAHGAFTMLDDAADATHTRVAYREGGPFLVGRGAWLDAMMNAASDEHAGPSSAHTALRASLSGDTHATVLLTALLPSTLRQRLKAEVTDPAQEREYASVLSVDQAGLAVSTGPAGSTTRVAAQLHCESADACTEVQRLLDKKRMALSRDFGVRLVGLGPLLDSLTMRADGTSLSLSASAPTDALTTAIERVLAYRSRSAPPATPVDSGASKY
ncbi:MAG TPA: hypothetical protein VF765_32125 [Polyangiaceae bacterium]